MRLWLARLEPPPLHLPAENPDLNWQWERITRFLLSRGRDGPSMPITAPPLVRRVVGMPMELANGDKDLLEYLRVELAAAQAVQVATTPGNPT